MKQSLVVLISLLLVSPPAAFSAEAPDAPGAVKQARPPVTAAPRRIAPYTGTMGARRISFPEPSGLHGWLVLTDPTSGERWYPTDETGRPHPGSRISMTLLFRNTQTGDTHEVFVKSPENIKPAAASHAWYYRVDFIHDTTTDRDPRREGIFGVRYNPNLWRFGGIVGEPWYRIFRPTEGANLVEWETRFQRRSTPFADLHDILP